MQVRFGFVAAILVATVFAGCASNDEDDADATDSTALAGGWRLDCSMGANGRAADAAWAQECEVRASKGPGSKTETWLAINPTDPQNVVIGAKDMDSASSADCVWNVVVVTHDGGKTWKDVTIGGKYADRQPLDPWFGYACNTDPMFQFSANGDLHYGVEVYNLGFQDYRTPLWEAVGSVGLLGWKILLATSHDGGDTWPDVITYQPDLVLVTDYSRMTVSPTTGTILEAINALTAGCHVLASRDGGQSAEPFALTVVGGVESCGSIAVSPAGVVVVGGSGGLLPLEASGPGVYFTRSGDDGRTFLESNFGFGYVPVEPFAQNEFRLGTHLEMIYDLTDGPNRGTLYALYAAADLDEADIFLRASSDDGRTWSEAVRVNGDLTKSHQFMGNLAVAGDGSVHVFFMDTQYDPGNKLLDVTHAVSLDGGRTWANERVSTVSFDGDLGRHQSGAPFIGDYIGVAAVGDHVWAGFPDTSGGETAVIAAAHVMKS